MVFCDPPYGVNYANSAKDKLRGKNRPILNDNLGEGFGAFLQAASANMLAVTKGAIYICMSSSELDTLQKAFREAGGKWSTFVIWAKNTFHARPRRLPAPVRADPLRLEGRCRAFLVRRTRPGRCLVLRQAAKNDLHPTMKPVALVERAIRNSSKSRDIVLDPFGGSGTTMIAAERTGRRARLLELDPQVRRCDRSAVAGGDWWQCFQCRPAGNRCMIRQGLNGRPGFECRSTPATAAGTMPLARVSYRGTIACLWASQLLKVRYATDLQAHSDRARKPSHARSARQHLGGDHDVLAARLLGQPESFVDWLAPYTCELDQHGQVDSRQHFDARFAHDGDGQV